MKNTELFLLCPENSLDEGSMAITIYNISNSVGSWQNEDQAGNTGPRKTRSTDFNA